MEAEEFYKKIKEHAPYLEKDAERGSPLAKQVISLYQMHFNSPQDPGALGLCMAAYSDWLDREPL